MDGEAGRLILRGFDLEALAGRVPTRMPLRIWSGLAPGAPALGEARVRAFRLFAPLARNLSGLAPVEGMRHLLAALSDAEADHPSLAVGGAAVAAAMAIRAAEGHRPSHPMQQPPMPPTSSP